MSLAALTALLAGAATVRSLPNGAATRLLGRSSALADLGMCASYVSVSRVVATRVTHARMAWSGEDAAALAAAAWPLTQTAHLADLLQWAGRGGEELDSVIGMYAAWLQVPFLVWAVFGA
jgi:hypothetical protein